MKIKLYILYLFFGMLCIPQINYAQIDFNKAPDDDLGNFEDEFQEYFYEAMKQYGIENYDRAVQNLQKCLELDNSQIVIHYQLGKNYNQLKNFGAAEEALKEALKIQPGNEWVLDEMYHVYIQQKEYNKAIKTVRQLVKYHQDYKEDLANIYVQTGNFKDAWRRL